MMFAAKSFFDTSRSYAHVWSKYRPAILKLMVDSVDGPQQYKLSPHEFRGANAKEKGGYTFTLRVFQGKAVNNIRTSPPAQDLLYILRQSRRASELGEDFSYEFILDKHFTLYVTRHEKTPDMRVAPASTGIPALPGLAA